MSNAGTVAQPFLAFVSDEKDLEPLRKFAISKGWSDSCILQGNISTASEYLKTNSSPPLLLVEISSAKEAPGELDGLAEVCDPSTKVIVTGLVNEYSFFCWLMDLGISSYLLSPLTEKALTGAVDKTQTPAAPSAAEAEKTALVIGVIGARGGVGATTLSINLAGIIAEKAQKKVALVDLDPCNGTISLALDLEPSHGFRDALESPERIDSLFLERVMSKPSKYLSVLSAEESIQEPLTIAEDTAPALLGQLKGAYDIIVLDIPRHLDAFSKTCLGMTDHVLLVTELTLLSLRDTLRIQDLMRETLKLKIPTVIAMRTGLAPKQQVVRVDFEKGIDNKIAYSIPFLPDIFMPIDLQIPAMQAKSNAALKPLFDLAVNLVPEVNNTESEKTGKKGGLLGKKKK